MIFWCGTNGLPFYEILKMQTKIASFGKWLWENNKNEQKNLFLFVMSCTFLSRNFGSFIQKKALDTHFVFLFSLFLPWQIDTKKSLKTYINFQINVLFWQKISWNDILHWQRKHIWNDDNLNKEIVTCINLHQVLSFFVTYSANVITA